MGSSFRGEVAATMMFVVVVIVLAGTGHMALLVVLSMCLALYLVWRAMGTVGFFVFGGFFLWNVTTLPGAAGRLTGSVLPGATVVELGIYVVGYVALLGALAASQSRRVRYERPPYVGLLLLFVASGFAAFAFGHSAEPGYAWRMLWAVCVAPTIIYLVAPAVVRKPNHASLIVDATVAGAALVALMLLVGYGVAAGTRLSGSASLGPFASVDLTANNGAVYMSLGAVMAVSRSLLGPQGWKRWLALMAAAVLSLAVVRTGTRVTAVALPAGLAVLVLLAWKVNGRRIMLAAGVLLVVAAFLAVVGPGLLGAEFASGHLGRYSTLTSLHRAAADPNWIGRVEVWREALGKLRENPQGIAYTRQFSVLRVSGAHNDYVALALATGIEGLVSVVLFMTLVLVRLVRCVRKGACGHLGWVVAGCVGCMVMMAIVDVATDPSKRVFPYLAFWLIVSVTVAGVASVDRERRRASRTWRTPGSTVRMDDHQRLSNSDADGSARSHTVHPSPSDFR